MSSLLLTLMLLLQATMDDPSASARAVALWGNIGHIGHDRGPFDTYWQKTVGYWSFGCQNDFTVLGRAPNTWEDAFAAVTLMPAGPYSGALQIKLRAYDDVMLAGVQLRLDGLPLGIEVPALSAVPVDLSIPWNSATVVNGVHNLCAVARDAAGNSYPSRPILFRTDQAVPSIAMEIRIP